MTNHSLLTTTPFFNIILMKGLFFLLLFCCSLGLMAQGRVIVDVVETYNGVRYEGDIVHYEYGKILTIRLADGEEVDLGDREIKRIRYAKQRKVAAEKQTTKASTSSYFASWKDDLQFKKIDRLIRPSLAINMNGGKNPDRSNQFFFGDERLFGFSVEGLVHYQLKPWIQAGLGASFDRFNTQRSESVLSFLGSVQLLPLPEKGLAPLVKLTGGYGQPLNTEGIDFEEAQGGLLLHPGIGLRIGRVDETFFTIDLGYRLLNTEISRPTFQGTEIRTNKYRRFSLRIGATF